MPTLNLLAIGNAIVDVISQIDEEFLEHHGLVKGAMTLIEAAAAEELYAEMEIGMEMSGGSAANTAVGVASLGGRTHFIGRVRDDTLGNTFADDLRAAGVAFNTSVANEGPATARSLVLVTPDAQRTMNTYLGACVELCPDDIDEGLIGRAQITYLEGYLWDRENAKSAVRKAAQTTKAAGHKLAFTLSDSFCVERWRNEFLVLIDEHVDVLFANEAEILSLYETLDLTEAISKVRDHCEFAAVTRSEKGSLLVSGDETCEVIAESVEQVVDTTGAGDLYAAGVLYGLVTGENIDTCGRIGSICAAEVISHYGARPETNLKALVTEKLAR